MDKVNVKTEEKEVCPKCGMRARLKSTIRFHRCPATKQREKRQDNEK